MSEDIWVTEVVLFFLVNIVGAFALAKRYWIKKATNPDVPENIVLAIACNNKFVMNCILTVTRLTTSIYLAMTAAFFILITNGVEISDFMLETLVFMATFVCFRLYGDALDRTSKQGLIIPDLITVNGETYDLSDIRGL